jgi:NADPH:quinone reductase-like Zn-dependent oxidoreductase
VQAEGKYAGRTLLVPEQVTAMRAIVQTRYGSTDTLSLADIDQPRIGAKDVLVHVRAAGLDRGTWHLMAGRPYAIRLAGYGLRAPKQHVPGVDVAGEVAAAGAEVTRFRTGDEVFGTARGSFAEYVAAAEDTLAPKPANLTYEQAAALPVSGLTALHGLTDVGRLEAGQRVLVIGASGGVGSYAVQIAKALGAYVAGVCSATKVDLVRGLGADLVVDYESADFADGEPYDLILDMGGNSSIAHLRRALAPRGTLVIAGGEGGGRWLGGADRQLRAMALSPFVRQRLTTFVSKTDAAGLDRLAALVADGRVVPAVERTYPLVEMPDAMRRLAAGDVRGKVVILP